MRIRNKRGSRTKLVGAITDFSGGMNTVDHNVKLKPNEFREIKNADITERGEIRRRGGFREIAKIDWKTFFTPSDTERTQRLNDALEQQGIQKVVTNAPDVFDLQINDWELFDEPQSRVINNYQVQIKTGAVSQTNEIKSINDEVIYNFLGQERLASETDDLKRYFPEACEKAQQELYNIKTKGLNLFNSAFGWSYGEQIEQLKGANSENKIVKNINILGLEDFQDLWVKKINDNNFLVLTNINYSNVESLNYFTRTSGLGKTDDPDENGTPFFPLAVSNIKQKWRELSNIPNIPFEIKVSLSYVPLKISEEKKVTLNVPSNLPLETLDPLGTSSVYQGFLSEIAVADAGGIIYDTTEAIKYLTISDLIINFEHYEYYQGWFYRPKNTEEWRSRQQKPQTVSPTNDTFYQYQLLVYKKIWPEHEQEPNDKTLAYQSPYSTENSLAIENLNLNIDSKVGQKVKIFFYIKVKERS